MDVVHPDFVRPETFRTAGYQDVFAIGRPGRRDEISLFVFAELFRIGSVGVCDPQVVCAVAIAGEGDHLAIRREHGLAVEGETAGYSLGLAALHWKSVEVANHVEENGLAIGRDGEGQPSAFVDREFYFALWLEGQAG